MTVEASDRNNFAKDSQIQEENVLKLEERIKKEEMSHLKSLDFFLNAETELDQRQIDDTSENNNRRRKIHSHKNYEFQGLSYRTISEDLNQIYEGIREDDGFRPENFKRNDTVSCVVDRKKYKGNIISVNQRGMVIKTQDRRKIRIAWEDVEDGEAKVMKLHSDEE
jgi:hypothetical protein